MANPDETPSSLPWLDPAGAGVPAATLIVFADHAGDGPAPILVVQRSEAMRFAPGAVVFPGGQVDPDDVRLGRILSPDLDPAESGARVAAIRETLEETGLGVGFDASASQTTAIRVGLAGGEGFPALLDTYGLTLDLEVLVPFARWNPRFADHKSFDTRFYVTQHAHRDRSVTPDGTENVATWWATAAEVLDDVESGRRNAIFPTHRNLERLSTLTGFVEAAEQAAAIGVSTVTPWIETSGSGKWLCIPNDAGYPISRVGLDDAPRN